MMEKKRHTAEQIISKLREPEVLLAKSTICLSSVGASGYPARYL